MNMKDTCGLLTGEQIEEMSKSIDTNVIADIIGIVADMQEYTCGKADAVAKLTTDLTLLRQSAEALIEKRNPSEVTVLISKALDIDSEMMDAFDAFEQLKDVLDKIIKLQPCG